MIALAVVLRILVNPLANVFQKKLLAPESPARFILFVTYFLLSIFTLPFARAVDWRQLPESFWLFALLTGFLGAIGNGFLLKALECGELSVLGPINAYKSVVGLIGGMIFLQELPGAAGIAGMALIVAGSYFVLDTTSEKLAWKIFRRPDIRYRIGAMVLAAIEAVFIKKTVLLSSPNISFIVWCWFGALFSFGYLLLQSWTSATSHFRSMFPDTMKFLALAACVGLMQLTTNYAFSAMPVAYALSLFQLSAIVSVLLGTHFFQEGSRSKKLAGTAVMIAGSAFIILG